MAQSVEWITGKEINYSSNPELLNYSITTSPDGSIWFGGLNQKKEFHSEAMGDLFLVQYNDKGEPLQEYIIEGLLLLRDIKSDADGYIYIVGQSLSYMVFWEGSTIEFPGSDIEGFFAKISPQGLVEWAINLSSLYPMAQPQTIYLSENTIYLTHYSWMGSMISEFDAGGNVVWEIEQQNVFGASDMIIDNEGNLYVTGSCADSQNSFGGVEFPTSFLYNFYLVKYNPEGVPQWVKFIKDITCSRPRLAIRDDGIILWTVDLSEEDDPKSGSHTDKGWVFGLSLTALNNDGDILWSFTSPDKFAGNARLAKNSSLQVMTDNSITVAGMSRGVIDWGNDIVTGKEGFDSEVLILNIDAYGVINWAISGGGPGHDLANAIEMDALGNIYVAAVGNDTVQFGSHSFTMDSFYYPFLVQLTFELHTTYPKLVQDTQLVCYPNPTSGNLVVETPLGMVGDISVISMQGQVVLQQKAYGTTTNINVSALSPGVYMVRMVHSSPVSTIKILVK